MGFQFEEARGGLAGWRPSLKSLSTSKTILANSSSIAGNIIVFTPGSSEIPGPSCISVNHKRNSESRITSIPRISNLPSQPGFFFWERRCAHAPEATVPMIFFSWGRRSSSSHVLGFCFIVPCLKRYSASCSKDHLRSASVLA